MTDTNLPPINNPVALTDLQRLREAQIGDNIPRRSTDGETADLGANLGAAGKRWNTLHVRRIVAEESVIGATTTGGGGGTVAPCPCVKSGKELPLQPGSSGFLLPGPNGQLRIVASDDDPLVMEIDGETYTLTSDVLVEVADLPTGGFTPYVSTLDPSSSVFGFNRGANELKFFAGFDAPSNLANTGGRHVLEDAHKQFFLDNGDEYIFFPNGANDRSIRNICIDLNARVMARATLVANSLIAIPAGWVFIDPTGDSPVVEVSLKQPVYSWGPVPVDSLEDGQYYWSYAAGSWSKRVGNAVVENATVVMLGVAALKPGSGVKATIPVRTDAATRKIEAVPAGLRFFLNPGGFGDNNSAWYESHMTNSDGAQDFAVDFSVAQGFRKSASLDVFIDASDLDDDRMVFAYVDDTGALFFDDESMIPIREFVNGAVRWVHPVRPAVMLAAGWKMGGVVRNSLRLGSEGTTGTQYLFGETLIADLNNPLTREQVFIGRPVGLYGRLTDSGGNIPTRLTYNRKNFSSIAKGNFYDLIRIEITSANGSNYNGLNVYRMRDFGGTTLAG